MARADDSLLFCNLPPRKSVTGLQEQPRLSYYNGNELQAVPFKWEASPGKPIVAESQPEPPGESPGLRLPPPPGAPPGGRRNRHIDEINRLSNQSARSNNVIFVPPTPEQKSGSLPKVKTGSSAVVTAASNGKTAAAAAVPAVPLAFAKPGHRRAFQSNDSVTTASARSDFDWPEVSDDDEEQPCTPPGHSNSRDPEVHQHAIFGRPKEESFSSSRSSDDGSNSFASSSPVNSGGSRGSGGSGGSARDLLLWRNLVRIAAATDVPPAAANAVPSKPPPAYSGDSEDDDDDDGDHARPMPRGLFACMPIFSRVRFIQSQLSKCEKDIPGVIDFSRRLPPRSKNKVYRS